MDEPLDHSGSRRRRATQQEIMRAVLIGVAITLISAATIAQFVSTVRTERYIAGSSFVTQQDMAALSIELALLKNEHHNCEQRFEEHVSQATEEMQRLQRGIDRVEDVVFEGRKKPELPPYTSVLPEPGMDG